MTKRAGKSKAKAASNPVAKATTTPDWPVFALAMFGMLLTAYLTGVAWWEGSPAFCSEGSGCDIIQQSRWSKVLGLPLALWGFLVYVLIAFAAYRPLSRLKRWKRLWILSLVGLAISLYLTVIGVVTLGAVCGWCLASLLSMAAIFIVVAVRRPPSAPEMPWWNWLVNTGCVALLAVGVLHLYFNNDLLTPPQDPRLARLVEHLESTGARYYGASWCTSCQKQKQLFGDVADQLPYVECSPYGRGGPAASTCTAQGIQNYPTWIINGQRTEGVLAPAELARRSGFEWEAEK